MFLKSAATLGAMTALPAQAQQATPRLTYVRHYETNVGAPPRTSCFFGKHTQWAYCSKDGKLYAYGGDGSWRLPDLDFKPMQSLNSVLSYNLAKGALFKQETPQLGRKQDGTMPWFHDGCTWVYNSQEHKFYAIPGYQPGERPAWDPHRIAQRGIVHLFNPATGAWEAGPAVGGNWVGEHWGGCYDAKRNRIWIQTTSVNEFGELRWFDCGTQSWGKIPLQRTPNLSRYPNIGFELITHFWCQRHNPVTDEILCFDAFRGHVVAIPLGSLPHAPAPRIVCDVPRYRNDVAGEPLSTIEAGVCLSVKRQQFFISYSMQDVYVAGGTAGGVWAVSLSEGTTQRADYPDPPGVNSQWTQAEYDDTNDCLILMANIVHSEVWGRRFLRYELKS